MRPLTPQRHRAQAAGVVITDDQERVLLVHHNYGLRRWSLPGGVVEPGETPDAAAVREALEEIGVQVRLTELHGHYLVHGLGRPDLDVYIYSAKIESGELRIADPAEIAELLWVDPHKPPQPLTTDARQVLKDLRAGRSGTRITVEREL